MNPISGVGRQKVIERLIDRWLDRTIYDYEVAYTIASKHAIELARDAASKDFDVVVAVGGDGSVNETAKGLIGSNTAMAIIPTGSGNGLARHLKIPLNLKKAMAVINRGKSTKIDTIRLNEETFVNVAGIGFDAHIGWEFAKFGKRGFSSYVKVIFREFPSYRPAHYKLSIDGKIHIHKAFLISFANGSQWGNNASIAPGADISDGIMDIAILRELNFWNGLAIAYRLFTFSLNLSPHLQTLHAKEVLISQPGTIAHIDGEPIETGHELKITVNPLSLKVIIP